MELIIGGIVLPWLVVALGCWLGLQLLRQNGRLLLRLDALEERLARLAPAPARAPAREESRGLPLGGDAPPFALPDLTGAPTSLAAYRGRRLLLLFFNPRCGFCTRMAPDLAKLPTDDPSQPLPLVIATGSVEENQKLVEEHGIRCPVLLQEQMEVGARYHAHGTPTGYLIDAQGKIASPLAVGADALLALATGRRGDGATGREDAGGHPMHNGNRDLADSKIRRDGLPAGTPAPDFTLPGLDGEAVSLSQYRGREVVVVFSDPRCGPCSQIAPELEQFHRRTGAAQVVMVSRGDAETNRRKAQEQGLTVPIGVQKQWEVSRAYGMFATPIAYRVNGEGVTAEAVAIGVEPIRGLLSRIEAEEGAPAGARRCPCGKVLGESGCGGRNGRETAAPGRQPAGARRR
jgi:peroxiredoxin